MRHRDAAVFEYAELLDVDFSTAHAGHCALLRETGGFSRVAETTVRYCHIIG